MTIKFDLYLNQDSMFREYRDGHKIIKVYSGEVDAGSKNAALSLIFEIFNVRHPEDYRNRSLSVGDVVVLHHDGTEEWFACQSVGWKSIGSKEAK